MIASTATIRRAADQLSAIFLRNVSVFPPPGLDVRDNFFAREREVSAADPGRLYIGICAPGKRLKAHSLAHALIRQFSLECGYATASPRERIYSRPPVEGDAMAGFLIYTAAPDSEGTMGGLVSLGEPDALARHLDQALEDLELCTSDPLCAESTPERHFLALHGAACHACLFAPETSCEKGNRYLDRSVLMATVERSDFAFFGSAGTRARP